MRTRLVALHLGVIVLAAGSGCGKTAPSVAVAINKFVIGVKAIGTTLTATRQNGAATAAGGPTATATGGNSALKNGTNAYHVVGSAPFQRVLVSVGASAGLADGFFDLTLPVSVSNVDVAVTFGSAIPENNFDLKFQVANAAGAIGTASTVGMAVATVAAPAPLTGTSLTANGAFRFAGLGADSTGRGTAFYNLGTCTNDTITTTCVLTGTYTENTGSHPGATGTYTLTTFYAGALPSSPIIARSTVADPNAVAFVDSLLNGGLINLAVSPSYGGLFVASIPPFPPTGLGFNAVLAPGATCTGVTPPSCTVAQVGLTNGAVLTGTALATGFTFTLPTGLSNTAAIR